MVGFYTKPTHIRRTKWQQTLISFVALILSHSSLAGPAEQAKRIHDRLAGVPPSQVVLEQMRTYISNGDTRAAADLAMNNANFYNVTLKNWVAPWTNEESDIFVPLNDYTATVIGIARDDVDFRQILSGDILYVANANLALPAYSNNNNNLYQALDEQSIDLQTALVATTQSAVTGLPAEATAGVLTTRAAAKSFFKDGTNRAMFRFTLINHMCTDLEGLKDTSLSPDRIRQDVSRSPGGDSRIFINSCSGCHTGMDPLAQSFAYYEYDYNVESDPNGENGSLQYNTEGQLDADTGSRVQGKYHINGNNFPFGFVTPDDKWDNYWRKGINQFLGWDDSLPGAGNGAKSMGQELAHSQAFAQCQVKKVFQNVCLRSPQDATDRSQIDTIVNNFQADGYKIKGVFANAADYCKGE
ncbi:hypothetical protein [Paraglaciecola sp. L3A3]|uniref:hypothetical protein n=1 Tax=Paraglaciecola sp. L3A3 TaxID=2686358 RepID=UPI001E3562E3|nr:hypothetical protein [Paraglaciecola sp. L3A3]